MRLNHGLHLAYCTNIHRGENWNETFQFLKQSMLAVRDQVCPSQDFAIGLRLSAVAAEELSIPSALTAFQRWMEKNHCYVFTINGFPYGRFHGARIKEEVYRPDWTSPERLEYTNRLFTILSSLLPKGVAGSVSTLPGSFKDFIQDAAQRKAICTNLWKCIDHISRLSESCGHKLHLGLEPEPFGLFENSAETITFFDELRQIHPHDERAQEFVGVNYDTCHFALQYETPQQAIELFRQNQIKISKVHLSSALVTSDSPETRKMLAAFAEDTYLHQVIVKSPDGSLARYRDLGPVLKSPIASTSNEWRIHFHIPLSSNPTSEFTNTSSHVLDLMKLLQTNPSLCSHFEMETYTWEVLPPKLKSRDVVTQIVSEYKWCLEHFFKHGFSPQAPS
jgi:hypothetical protein